MKTMVLASAAPHESDETETIITVLHPDILRTHILSRLDGTALAVASSVSAKLRHLCIDDDLWRNICIPTWPSLVDPIASQVISTFPGGHRSIFLDAFPSLHYDNHHPYRAPSELISAVDIYCQGKAFFSTVQRIETEGNTFDFHLPLQVEFQLPFQVDVLQQNVSFPNSNSVYYEEFWKWKYLQDNLRLSWIVIDPTRKRAANLSSWKPVSVVRYCNTDVEVAFAVVVAGDPYGSREKVRCVVKVMCCRKLQVREVKMKIEDMDGLPVTRREGLMILQNAIGNGERKKVHEITAKERSNSFSSRIFFRKEIMSQEQEELYRYLHKI